MNIVEKDQEILDRGKGGKEIVQFHFFKVEVIDPTQINCVVLWFCCTIFPRESSIWTLNPILWVYGPLRTFGITEKHEKLGGGMGFVTGPASFSSISIPCSSKIEVLALNAHGNGFCHAFPMIWLHYRFLRQNQSSLL